MISWSEEEYNDDHGIYPLYQFITPSTIRTYSSETKLNAYMQFLDDIFTHIRGKIKSLSVAMREGIDDDW